MADIVKVDDQVIKVEVKKQDDKFCVFLNGAARQVKVADNRGSNMTLIIDDKPFDVIFADENTIIVNNQEYAVDIFNEQVAKLMKTGAGKVQKQELVVKAAMPGLIIEVSVKEGEGVNEGQGLLIIEAMKMQNEMYSSRAGVIKKINVKTGQIVNRGDKLIVIE
ncbi:MAG: biotin/lipoyl-containing protein [bacterium]